jgi:hypothetical protein
LHSAFIVRNHDDEMKKVTADLKPRKEFIANAEIDRDHIDA